jgi:hypothetical protein
VFYHFSAGFYDPFSSRRFISVSNSTNAVAHRYLLIESFSGIKMVCSFPAASITFFVFILNQSRRSRTTAFPTKAIPDVACQYFGTRSIFLLPLAVPLDARKLIGNFQPV